MFAQQVFQDFKENVKSTLPIKTNTSNRKGLKSCSLNSFNDSSNVLKNKKKKIETQSCSSELFFKEKENSKPKVEAQEKKVNHNVEDTWSDIEEMHICVEPDDDYEDILPQCDRIQKADIDSLFMTYSYTKYVELTVDKLPSPLKEFENFDIPDFSPLLEVKAPLYDDSELYFIPLPNDLF